MFNKTVFNRKDPVPRRETPVPESTVPGSETAATDKAFVRTVNSAKEQVNPGSDPRPLPQAGRESAKDSKAHQEDNKERSANSTSADKDIGARLIVGPDVKLKGAQILDCDTLVVEGYVEATMDSRVIRIAERGSFNGKVSVDIAEIHGSFDGELTARLQLIIHSTAKVKGSIRYGKLVADEGCELSGNVDILSGERHDRTEPPAIPILALGTSG